MSLVVCALADARGDVMMWYPPRRPFASPPRVPLVLSRNDRVPQVTTRLAFAQGINLCTIESLRQLDPVTLVNALAQHASSGEARVVVAGIENRLANNRARFGGTGDVT